jgi:hypothetical protein
MNMMQLPYLRLRPCFAPFVFSCIVFSFSCLPGIAQVCAVSLTGLSYDNAAARYLIKGWARLDGVAAPSGSILEERLRVSVQFISAWILWIQTKMTRFAVTRGTMLRLYVVFNGLRTWVTMLPSVPLRDTVTKRKLSE